MESKSNENGEMMEGLDVLKSYLVAVGFKTDISSLTSLKKNLGDLSSGIRQQAGAMAGDYAKAGTIIASTIASVTAATATMISKVATADLGYQKFALHMAMTKENAKSLKIVMDAMGETPENIAWIPELRHNYEELLKVSKELEMTDRRGLGGADERLKAVRDIRLEYQKFKVEATYGTERVVDELMKLLAGPGTDIKKWLQDLNKQFRDNIPEWSKKSAEYLHALLIRVKALGEYVFSLTQSLFSLKDSMSENQKALALWGAAIGLFFVSGPIGKALEIMLGLVAAIDDFYKYCDGRKSSDKLAPIWNDLLKVIYEVEKSLKSISLLLDQIADSKMAKMASIIAKLTFKSPGGGLGDFFGLDIFKGGSGLLPFLNKESQEKLRQWDKEHGGTYNQERNPFKGVVSNQFGEKSYWDAAQKVAMKTGVPAPIVMGQFRHETGGFTNRGATSLNNLTGMKDPKGQYKKFGSLDEYADYYASYLNRNVAGVDQVKTPEQFAALLKRGNKPGAYYEAKESEYAAGIRKNMGQSETTVPVGITSFGPASAMAYPPPVAPSVPDERKNKGVTGTWDDSSKRDRCSLTSDKEIERQRLLREAEGKTDKTGIGPLSYNGSAMYPAPSVVNGGDNNASFSPSFNIVINAPGGDAQEIARETENGISQGMDKYQRQWASLNKGMTGAFA